MMRKSIFVFLKYFHYFSTIPVLLLLPFSASILITKSFPTSSKFGLFLTNSFSDSILITPLALSLFLIAKAYVIQALNHHHHHHGPSLPPFSSCLPLYKPLLQTHLCNMVLIRITTSMVFAIFVLITASGFLHGLLQLVTRIVLYAFVTNIVVLCNLGLVVAGVENCTGYRAIYKAYLVRRSGRNSAALFLLAIPTQLGLASIETLFWYRLVRAYDQLGGRLSSGLALEGLLIAYLYSIVIVLDTIACWCFSKAALQIVHTKCLQVLVLR
ncbi:hypothetical protein FNV43_RR14499 [Rhamnella rubrinervis]|uniref:Uncharacterized protein n=1 Tax=Rhamnella rubrinervis TaxID=2594499 RepID=A0A8K0H320_9ROSA|nr:hypothetical protein FNV43_RR14499 [Rhamnella rubrinervis]